MQMSGLGLGAMMLSEVPVVGSPVAEAQLLAPWLDAATKKKLAETALNAARDKGATYTDVRIGPYFDEGMAMAALARAQGQGYQDARLIRPAAAN